MSLNNIPKITDRRFLIDDDWIESNPAIIKSCLDEGFSAENIAAASTLDYRRGVVDLLRDPSRTPSEIVRKGMTEAGGGSALVPIQWIPAVMGSPGTYMLQSRVNIMPVTTRISRTPRLKSTDSRYTAYPVVASWAGETPASPTDQSSNLTIEMIEVTASELYCYGGISISLAEDSNALTILPEIFRRSVATATDEALVSGDGSNKPFGINEASGGVPLIGSVTTGSAGAISYDDLVNTYFAVPEQYRATSAWLTSSASLKLVSKVKDSQGLPVLQPNASGGGHGQIFGRDVLVSEFLPAPTTGNVAIYCGDFKTGYVMTERLAPTIRVLDQPGYKNGVYEAVLRCRRGGRLVFPDAIRSIKIA